MRRAGDILRLFLDENTAEQADLYQGFFAGWGKIVGEQIAAHSRVKDIQNGIVIVEVDHPGWIQMLQLKQTQVVTTLRKKYPDLEIRGLRLQLPWKGYSTQPKETPPVDEHEAQSHRQEPEADETGAAEAPADPLIRGALEKLGRAIEEREDTE